MPKNICLDEISIYPIKSTAEIQLSTAWIDDFGLSFDRRFVLSDMNGNFITARTHASICLIKSQLTKSGLVLTAPNMPKLFINTQSFSESYESVTVWDSDINAQHCSDKYDQWFSQYIGIPCRLVYFGDNSSRQVKNSDKQVAFSDGYPLLLISKASLDDLSSRVGQSLSMSQFRPNLVTNNEIPYEEDTWKRIRIGEVEFEVVKPCSRCIFTTIDPKTATKDENKEPLNTLTQYRQVEKGDVMFGQNLIAVNNGAVSVGDKIEVLETQNPPTFKKNVQTTQSKPTSKEVVVNSKPRIHFSSTNKTIKGNNQDTILEQAEDNNVFIPYSCRGGMCGSCKIKLNSGEVTHLAVDGLTQEEFENGYILACSTIPKTDISIDESGS